MGKPSGNARRNSFLHLFFLHRWLSFLFFVFGWDIEWKFNSLCSFFIVVVLAEVVCTFCMFSLFVCVFDCVRARVYFGFSSGMKNENVNVAISARVCVSECVSKWLEQRHRPCICSMYASMHVLHTHTYGIYISMIEESLIVSVLCEVSAGRVILTTNRIPFV